MYNFHYYIIIIQAMNELLLQVPVQFFILALCSFFQSLVILSSAFSLSHLLSLQYYNKVIVSLCCDLNVLLNVLNSHSTVLMIFCSAWMRASRNCRAYLSGQFLTFGTQFTSFVSHVWKMMFETSPEVSEFCVLVCGTPIR